METVEPMQSSFKSSPQNAFLSVFLAFVWTVHSLARFCLSRFGIVGDWDGMSRFAQGQTVMAIQDFANFSRVASSWFVSDMDDVLANLP